jgi:replication factor C subunit 3/5
MWCKPRGECRIYQEHMICHYIIVYSVKLTDDGKKALLKLSKGDMRRALNVLQACHAAYDITREEEIYNCTGNPHPTDIESIVNSMLADEFTTSYQSAYNYLASALIYVSYHVPTVSVVEALKTERGLALQDMLVGAYEYIDTIEFPPAARIYLLDNFATIEYVLLCNRKLAAFNSLLLVGID